MEKSIEQEAREAMEALEAAARKMPVEQIRDLTQKLEFAAGLQEARRKAG